MCKDRIPPTGKVFVKNKRHDIFTYRTIIDESVETITDWTRLG